MDFIGRIAGVRDLNRHRCVACGFLDLDPVGVPADGIAAAIFAADVCPEGDGVSGEALLTRDLDRQTGKDSRHIQILLEVGVRAGLAGLAVAPLYKDMALGGDCGHGKGFGRVADLIAQALARVTAAAQGAAAALFDLIPHLILSRRFLALAGAFTLACTGSGALTAADRFGAAGCRHRRTGVGNIFQRPGRDTGCIRAAILCIVGMSADVVQHRFQADGFQMDVAAGIIIRVAIAIRTFQYLRTVQELQTQLLTHI